MQRVCKVKIFFLLPVEKLSHIVIGVISPIALKQDKAFSRTYINICRFLKCPYANNELIYHHCVSSTSTTIRVS